MTWDKPFLQVFSTQDKQQQVKKQSKIQKTPRVYKDQYSHLLNPPLACRLAFWSLDFSTEADSICWSQAWLYLNESVKHTNS